MRIGLSILFVVSVAGMPQAAALGADSDKPVQPATVTFSKDVAPILERSCQTCHRPGSVAPMSLLTYEEARPWAKAMKLRTSLRSKPNAMPPWFIEKNIGIQQFKGDVSLSDAEIDKIARWADNGAPQGNPADA